MYIWGVKSQYKGISATACLFFRSSFDYTYSSFDSFFLCLSLLCLCRLSRLYSSCFSLITVSLHPVCFCVLSLYLCAPAFCALVLSSTPPHAVSCLTISAVYLSCFSGYSFSPLFLSCSCCVCVCALSLSLPVFSFVPPPFPIFFSQCLGVYSDQRKGIVYYCQYKRGRIYSVFVYGEKAEDEWFLCIFDLSLFPVAHIFSSGANEQHKLTTKQRDLHERIKWEL